MNGLEMLEQAFLGRLVVIGAYDERSIGPLRLSLPSELDRVLGRICARSGDDRCPALRHLDAQGDNTLVLVVAERRRFAGSAARHQATRALSDLPSHELLKGAFVETSAAEGCDQRDERSLEHCFPPRLRRN